MRDDIEQFMEKDHTEIDSIFERFQERRTGTEESREEFSEFRRRLERHIRWEEDILFPEFEERTSISGGGPTEVMRQEHDQIRDHLGRIEEGLEAERETGEEEEKLLQTLSDHNRKEENILYPWFDEELSEEERREILEELRGDS
ncbi:MAG: hemerythrin domain-containing protein [Candidatus Nanohaloarchaea archaeon]